MSHLRCVLVSCSCTARFLNHLVHSTSPTPYQSISSPMVTHHTNPHHSTSPAVAPQTAIRRRISVTPASLSGRQDFAGRHVGHGGHGAVGGQECQGGQECKGEKGWKEEGKPRFMRACLTRESRLVMANSIVSSGPYPGVDPAQDSWSSEDEDDLGWRLEVWKLGTDVIADMLRAGAT